MASIFSEAADIFLGDTQGSTPSPHLLDMLMAASKAQDLLKGAPLRTTMRVAVMAGSIARRMGLPNRDVNAIVYASLIYDLGLARIAADLHAILPPGVGEKKVFATHALMNARVISNPTSYTPPQDSQTSSGIHTDLSSRGPATIGPLPPPSTAPTVSDISQVDLLPSLSATGKIPLSSLIDTQPTVQQILAQHPQMSAQLVERFALSDDVRAIIESHHELCDGSGYPFGLTRHNIPMGARILALADTVESVMLEVTGLTTRQQALSNFLDVKAHDRFDSDVIMAFKLLLEDYPEFLKLLASLDVEGMCHQLVREREQPLSGSQVLAMAEALGELPDLMIPLYRKGHAQKVARIALRMASHLGISRHQEGELLLAALLHDVGHVSTPVEILLKQQPLHNEDWQVIRTHPHFTEEILKNIPGFENIALWASEHHERMNGKGYPSGKKGYEISVGGRLIAIADVYDALTSPRPYRTHAHEPLDALPILGQGRFSQFDNQLISLLRRVVLDSEVVVR